MTMIKVPTAELQTPIRLRRSCDRCQTAKVKCSRMKPSCWRCSQDGRPCVYSPFRRTGRPRKSARPPPEGREVNPNDTGNDSTPHAKAKQGKEDIGPGNEQHEQFHTALSQIPDERERTQQIQEAGRSVSGLSLTDVASLAGTAQPSTVFAWQTQDLMENWNPILEAQPQSPMDLGTFDPVIGFDSLTGSRHGSIDSIDSAQFPSFGSDLGSWSTGHDLGSDASSTTFTSTAAQSWDDFALHPTQLGFSDAATKGDDSAKGERPDMIPRLKTQPSPSPFADIMALPPSPPPSPHSNCKCFETVSHILNNISDQDGVGRGLELEKSLELNNKLLQITTDVLMCRRCLCNGNSTNQVMIMSLFMALDNLLGQFETHWAAAAALDAGRPTLQLSYLDQPGVTTGGFMVDDMVKTASVRHSVLSFLRDHDALSLQLEEKADLLLNEVYRRMAKEMTSDIGKRTFFLRSRLKSSG